MRSTPKGLWPAVTETQSIGFHRLRLYQLYDDDRDLHEQLEAMRADWWGRYGSVLRGLVDTLPNLDDSERRLAARLGPERAAGYFADLAALGSHSGLDRIPAFGTPPDPRLGYLPIGVAQAHRFLRRVHDAAQWAAAPELAARQSPPIRAPTFTNLASFGALVPAVDKPIAGTRARWDPHEETRADARRRIRVETGLAAETIEGQLERIAREGGYRFPDTSSSRSGIYRLERDAQWAWWRLRRRWTYEQIAEEWNRLHRGDLRLQVQRHKHPADEDDLGDENAREWEAGHPGETWTIATPEEATRQVRKAVATFADRARIDVTSGPGRRAARA